MVEGELVGGVRNKVMGGGEWGFGEDEVELV